MLNFYYKQFCPYSTRVLTANEQIGAPLTLVDISANPKAQAALLALGGKTQVPFLEDSSRGVSLYESLDIIDYLHTHYGRGVAPVAQFVPNVCPID